MYKLTDIIPENKLVEIRDACLQFLDTFFEQRKWNLEFLMMLYC